VILLIALVQLLQWMVDGLPSNFVATNFCLSCGKVNFMFNGKSILAVIPARAGSKGLPNKNLLKINGKELVGWPICAAIESKICDQIVCSTDSAEIAEVAKRFGAEVPWLRPNSLALDNTLTSEVILHVISYFISNQKYFDYVLLLEPTSPLTSSRDILEAMELITTNYSICESVVSVTENVAGHPDFTFQMDHDSKIISSGSAERWTHKRRQEIKKCYFIEGTIYVSTIASFLKEKTFIHERTIGMEVPKWKSFEIDDLLDVKIIEMIMADRGIN
jgi:CMP-N,N'-diacetyllegionaminic acid synthase